MSPLTKEEINALLGDDSATANQEEPIPQLSDILSMVEESNKFLGTVLTNPESKSSLFRNVDSADSLMESLSEEVIQNIGGSDLNKEQTDLILGTVLTMNLLPEKKYASFEQAYNAGVEAGEKKVKTKIESLIKLLNTALE